MATQREILNDMLANLARAEPDLDTGIGSVVRKMLDAVAEAIAERDANDVLQGYAYDIDMKSGADLDEMVRLFGFSRLPSRRASGEITFSRSAPSATSVVIPMGVQIQTDPAVLPVVTASTIVQASILPGDTSVTVPATVAVGGAPGNVEADTLTFRRTAIEGIVATTNTLSFSGGTDAENDAHLRKRFKDSIFRSLAGTQQMFYGIALDDQSATHANVIGATKSFRESVEIASGAATSTVQDAAYIVPDSALVGTSLSAGSLLKEGVHYSVNYGVNPPELTVLMASAMPNGGIFDWQFEYVPNASRNDLANGIVNRVDVYVRGERAVAATASLSFDDSRVFTASGALDNDKFRRNDESTPTVGHFFVPYPLVPVLDPSVNDQITIDGIVMTEDTHYWLVYDTTAFGQAPRSLAGIEIASHAISPLLMPTNPDDGSPFTVDYIYNEVPRSIEEAISGTWRTLNQDVWVHQGKPKRLRLNLGVIIGRGYTEGQVQAAIYRAINNFIDGLGFANVVQASDLLSVAHGVAGVDAVRFLTDDDNGLYYAIQRVDESGGIAETFSTGSPARAVDVYCADDEFAVLDTVFLDVMAQNTFGAS